MNFHTKAGMGNGGRACPYKAINLPLTTHGFAQIVDTSVRFSVFFFSLISLRVIKPAIILPLPGAAAVVIDGPKGAIQCV